MNGSIKSSSFESTTKVSGDITSDIGRPLSPTSTVNDFDSLNIELSAIVSFQKQQAEIISLFSEFSSMRGKMYQLSGNMSENTIDDSKSRHDGILPQSFHADRSESPIGQGQNGSENTEPILRQCAASLSLSEVTGAPVSGEMSTFLKTLMTTDLDEKRRLPYMKNTRYQIILLH